MTARAARSAPTGVTAADDSVSTDDTTSRPALAGSSPKLPPSASQQPLRGEAGTSQTGHDLTIAGVAADAAVSPLAASPSSAGPTWLILTYRVPSEPSRLRATVWRRLKAMGAIYLHNSVATLPAAADAERQLRTLRAEIGELGGTAQLFRADALAGNPDVIAAYNAARDDEYEELIDKCQDFLAELHNETAAHHFTYGELEENDEELAKLRRWHAKLDDRDVLGAVAGPAARSALDACTAALDRFAQHVYRADTDM